MVQWLALWHRSNKVASSPRTLWFLPRSTETHLGLNWWLYTDLRWEWERSRLLVSLYGDTTKDTCCVNIWKQANYELKLIYESSESKHRSSSVKGVCWSSRTMIVSWQLDNMLMSHTLTGPYRTEEPGETSRKVHPGAYICCTAASVKPVLFVLRVTLNLGWKENLEIQEPEVHLVHLARPLYLDQENQVCQAEMDRRCESKRHYECYVMIMAMKMKNNLILVLTVSCFNLS